MLMGVNPGMVLISLIQTLPVLRSRKKSTRASPEPSIALKDRKARSRISSALLDRRCGGNLQPAVRIHVFGFVIIKFMSRKHFPYYGSLRVIVPENRAFQFTPVDSLFNQDLAIELSGISQSRSQIPFPNEFCRCPPTNQDWPALKTWDSRIPVRRICFRDFHVFFQIAGENGPERQHRETAPAEKAASSYPCPCRRQMQARRNRHTAVRRFRAIPEWCRPRRRDRAATGKMICGDSAEFVRPSAEGRDVTRIPNCSPPSAGLK